MKTASQRNVALGVGIVIGIAGATTAIALMGSSNGDGPAPTPAIQLSALNSPSGTLTPSVNKVLASVPMTGPFTGAHVADSDEGPVFLAQNNHGTICVAIDRADGAAVSCTERSALASKGLYLLLGESGHANGVIVVPDGYSDVSVSGNQSAVGHNVAIVHDVSASEATLSGPGVASVKIPVRLPSPSHS